MKLNWDEIQQAIVPIKDYEELVHRWQVSFSYPFVRDVFNYSITKLIIYTRLVLEGDTRGRYGQYSNDLVRILNQFKQSGVRDVVGLLTRLDSRRKLEEFSLSLGMDGLEIVKALKFLAYWFIPTEKYLSSLVRDGTHLVEAVKKLGGIGIRTNLQLLQQGRDAAGRQELVRSSGLSENVVYEAVNLADLSRLPWTSKATVANIMGAGYGSISRLANARAEKLFSDYFNHGKTIGKNLKLGNEIDNSQRIAKIVPPILQNFCGFE